MTQIQTFQNSSFKIECVCVDGNPWFRGRDVATILGYNNTTQALRVNVDEDDRKKMDELGKLSDSLPDANAKKTIYINESGLYSLILRSEKPEAKSFKKWVCSEVLPSIRKRGSYAEPPPPPAITPIAQNADPRGASRPAEGDAKGIALCGDPVGGVALRGARGPLRDYRTNRSFSMQSENDLHAKVVDYIRRFYPHAKMMAGLGEFQKTSALRIEGWQKGYQKGTADLMIMNNHLEYRGFCLEFKNPKGTGSLAEAQDAWLNDLRINGYKVVVSNDYDVICREIETYFEKVRLVCPHCVSKPIYFKTQATMQQHIVAFHRINN